MTEPDTNTTAIGTPARRVVVAFGDDEVRLIARALAGVPLNNADLQRAREIGHTLESRAEPEMNLVWISWPDVGISFDVYLRPRRR